MGSTTTTTTTIVAQSSALFHLFVVVFFASVTFALFGFGCFNIPVCVYHAPTEEVTSPNEKSQQQSGFYCCCCCFSGNTNGIYTLHCCYSGQMMFAVAVICGHFVAVPWLGFGPWLCFGPNTDLYAASKLFSTKPECLFSICETQEKIYLRFTDS